MSASHSSSQDSSRYQQLERLIAMGLQRARKAIDAKALVEATYDGDVFGTSYISSQDNDECQDMLVDVMNGMLDKITTTIGEAPLGNTTTTIIKERLDFVDATIAKIVTHETETKQHERDDRAAAVQALGGVLLPAGVTLEDLLRVQEYQRRLQERQELQEQLRAIGAEVAALEDFRDREGRSVSTNVRQLQTVAKELGRSADACSMVASG
jgi:uncharacterized protein YicC (UPF0701 family)